MSFLSEPNISMFMYLLWKLDLIDHDESVEFNDLRRFLEGWYFRQYSDRMLKGALARSVPSKVNIEVQAGGPVSRGSDES